MSEKIQGKLRWDENVDLGKLNHLGKSFRGTLLVESDLLARECGVFKFYKDRVPINRQKISELFQLTASTPAEEDHHVVKYYHLEEDPDFWYIATEKFDSLLEKYLKHRKEKNTEIHDKDLVRENIHLVLGAAKGLAYLHQNDYVHKHINPASFVVNYGTKDQPAPVCKLYNLDIKVTQTDGSSSSLTYNFGRDNWIATELKSQIKQSRTNRPLLTYNKKSDVWAFGCLVHYIFNRCQHPFDDPSSSLALKQIQGKGKVAVSDWVIKMISKDPTERPTMEEIVKEITKWDDYMAAVL